MYATETNLALARDVMERFKKGETSSICQLELWNAKKLLDSTIHPDTGERILLPFRMASFVPTNVAIVAGMLRPNPSVNFFGFIVLLGFLISKLSLTTDGNYYSLAMDQPVCQCCIQLLQW